MKKTLVLEVEFEDGFVPPDCYTEPSRATHWKTPCSGCPFFVYNDEGGSWCCLDGADKEECPIKNLFE